MLPWFATNVFTPQDIHTEVLQSKAVPPDFYLESLMQVPPTRYKQIAPRSLREGGRQCPPCISVSFHGSFHGCSNSGEKPKSRDKRKVGERVSLEYLLSELSDDDINAQ